MIKPETHQCPEFGQNESKDDPESFTQAAICLPGLTVGNVMKCCCFPLVSSLSWFLCSWWDTFLWHVTGPARQHNVHAHLPSHQPVHERLWWQINVNMLKYVAKTYFHVLTGLNITPPPSRRRSGWLPRWTSEPWRIWRTRTRKGSVSSSNWLNRRLEFTVCTAA